MPKVETKVDADLLAIAVYSGAVTVKKLPRPVYYFNARKLTAGIYKGYKKSLLTVTYNSPDEKLLKHLRTNIYMFSAAKTFQQVAEMNKAMTTKTGVVPFNEFKKIVNEISDRYNENWLGAEYNTAVAQAQSASAWQRFVREKNTLSLLRYSTIGDPCDICAPLDGMTAPVDDPVWDELMPPNHFNCECIVEQEDAEDTDATEESEVDDLNEEVGGKMEKVFKSNPGKSGDAFDKSHPYFSVPKEYKEFAKDNFGLDIPQRDE